MKRLSIVLAALTLAAAVPVLTQGGAQTPPTAPAPAAQQPQPPQAPLGANEWRLDANHSAANFSVKHNVVSTVRGQLGKITGTIEYDGKDIKTLKADVAIDMQGINTQNQSRDNHLRSADFFDVANHPQLTFKSKRVEPGAAGHFRLIGDLTIRGNTKEVVLEVEGPSPVVKGPRGVLTGASATTKISRKEFGVLWNNLIEALPVVGDEVSITIDLELNRPGMPGTQQ
jgi:polyisoprenoid-binding protein YceI